VLRAEVITDERSAQDLAAGWDALAVACRRPYCAPGWMLAWWHHLGSIHDELRIVAVFDGNDLVGVGPFFVDVTARGAIRWRLLASETSTRVEPLALPRIEHLVAPVMVEAVARGTPAPDLVTFEGTVGTSLWPRWFRAHWPEMRRPLCQVERATTAPTLTFAALTFEEWFASRSRNFREMRRKRRRLEDAGAVFKVARTPEEVRAAVPAFARLHETRWSARGGSAVLDEGVEAMVGDAGAAMARDSRLRLWTIEVEGRTIATEIFVAAGGEVSHWLGGFDEDWARFGPSLLLILAAIEQAWELGDRRFDLGAGSQDYKGRFANGADTVEWSVVVPPLAQVLSRPALIPWYAGRHSFGRLPPVAKERIRAATPIGD
jgi:CelD/BcsL family acetyltransferase involved in cellulose biosynthesis